MHQFALLCLTHLLLILFSVNLDIQQNIALRACKRTCSVSENPEATREEKKIYCAKYSRRRHFQAIFSTFRPLLCSFTSSLIVPCAHSSPAQHYIFIKHCALCRKTRSIGNNKTLADENTPLPSPESFHTLLGSFNQQKQPPNAAPSAAISSGSESGMEKNYCPCSKFHFVYNKT